MLEARICHYGLPGVINKYLNTPQSCLFNSTEIKRLKQTDLKYNILKVTFLQTTDILELLSFLSSFISLFDVNYLS